MIQFDSLSVLPYPQVVLSGLHKKGKTAAIATESSHQWWFFWHAIPDLNEVRCWNIIHALDVHADQWNIDVCSLWPWDNISA